MCALINGLLPSLPPEAPNLRALNLRLYQRITAQVMEVRGVEAVLMIEGTPVVVKMPTAEQAADLLRQGTAQFIITKLTPEGITLRQARQDQQQTTATIMQPRDLATRLLESMGMAKSPETMMLAQAALRHGVLITPEMMSELETALQQLDFWGQDEADLTVALKAAGLPVTPGSIQMAFTQVEGTAQTVQKLLGQLRNLLTSQKAQPELVRLVQNSIMLLEKMLLKWQGNDADLSDMLKNLIHLMGRSFENEIAQQLKDSKRMQPGESLLLLGKLLQSLKENGQAQLANEVEFFLLQLRQNHLSNVPSDPDYGRGHWAVLELPVSIAQRNAQQTLSAKIRLARRDDPSGSKIDPTYTRLVIQVDLEEGKTVEVDLALAGNQAQVDMLVPDGVAEQVAVAEWPELQTGLQALGYHVKTSRIDIGFPAKFGRLSIPKEVSIPFQSVDIEI